MDTITSNERYEKGRWKHLPYPRLSRECNIVSWSWGLEYIYPDEEGGTISRFVNLPSCVFTNYQYYGYGK